MMAKWWLVIRTVLLLGYLLWLRWVFRTGTYHGLLSWVGLILLVAIWVGDRRYHQSRYTAMSWLWQGAVDVVLAVVIQVVLVPLWGFAWYQPVILALLVIGRGVSAYRLGRQPTGQV
ncbi:hypothetical protein [Levilactobacillus enshiensis]|uniref:hypothetical protein n=1 Tax=Levilactobacillus enshiensis TaxID=2590213 RepID=UPI00131BBBD2|nr:hypothetical protein [Levilactobacillus enshiensis]